MSIIHLNESSSGATRNSGTNGDLNALMKWALVTNAGWTNPFTQSSPFGDIFKPPSGNGFSLFVAHDSTLSGTAQLAVVRGCESASAANTAGLTSPFPTAAQIVDGSCNWLVSTTATTTTRNFDIYIGPNWVIYLSNYSSTANTWEIGMWGDFSAALSGDIYNTLCLVRNSNVFGSSVGWNCVSNVLTGKAVFVVCRSYDGTIKSVTGAIRSMSSAGTIGNIPNASAPLAGPTGLIDREKCSIFDTGNTSTANVAAKGVSNRGWVQNMWQPLHSALGATNSRDTFTDTVYNGSALFRIFGNAPTSAMAIIEESNTWSPPNG